MNRQLVSLSALCFLAASAEAMAQPAMPGTPELIGEFVLPTGLKIGGVEFGGISGIDYDAADDVFYAISDDRSQRAPARFYVLKLAIGEDRVAGVDVVSTHTLLGLDGQPFAEGGIDPEAIRFDPNRQVLFWSSEGDGQGVPAIYEADLSGKAIRQFVMADAYLPTADKTAGVYGNLAFESLTLSADGSQLLAGTENALIQDGAKASLDTGSPSRIIVFDIESGSAGAEYIYETGPIALKSTAEPHYNDNGLSEFLMLTDDRLLTVERSFGSGVGNVINFYLTDLSVADDVGGVAAVAVGSVKAASKALWFTIGEGDFGLDIDNIEAISQGPVVGGKQTLVIASDNNFNPDGQFSQFAVFALPEL